MNYKTVKELALKWNISERSIRDYCNKGRILGAILNGKTWMIPLDVQNLIEKLDIPILKRSNN